MVPHSVSRLLSDVFGTAAAESATGPRSSPTRQAQNRATDRGQSAAISDTPDRRLRVCLLSYRSNPYSGGQGVYIRYLSRALADLGHDVDVVSGRPYPHLDSDVSLVKLPGENIVEETDRLRAFDPSYLRQPTNLFEWVSVLTGGFPEPYTFGRRAVDYLADRGDQYDVVHDNQSLCYGLLELDLPIVATVHHPITVDRQVDLAAADGLRDRLLVRRWYRFLRMQRRVVSDLPHVICVSRAARRRTVSDFGVDPDAISTIYNGIDTELFAPRPDVPERDGRIMATLSADVPVKGPQYLLRAFADVHDRHPETELVVVGDLDEDSDARQLAARLDIEKAITTYSGISYDQLVELYGSATLAVVSSLFEGFGLPAGEAMACGVPTVATTGGALPEVVGDAGELVPPADPEALAEAISGLLSDPARRRRLGSRGRERMVEGFDWERTARETAAEYARAIDAHR